MISRSCKSCGKVKPLDQFTSDLRSKDGRSKQCMDCKAAAGRRWRKAHNEHFRNWKNDLYWRDVEKHRTEVRERQQRQRKAQPLKALLRAAKQRARIKGMDFNLTVDDLQQPPHCPVLGIQLSWGLCVFGPASPTLDRVDNTRGYVRGNVIVVSHKANMIKSSATVEEIEQVARFYRALLDSKPIVR